MWPRQTNIIFIVKFFCIYLYKILDFYIFIYIIYKEWNHKIYIQMSLQDKKVQAVKSHKKSGHL